MRGNHDAYRGQHAYAGPRHVKLAGIEVHRQDHPDDLRRSLAALAGRLGLLACGGSDFHRPDEALRPGDTGDPPLPPDIADRLLAVGGGGDSDSVTA